MHFFIKIIQFHLNIYIHFLIFPSCFNILILILQYYMLLAGIWELVALVIMVFTQTALEAQQDTLIDGCLVITCSDTPHAK